MGGTHGTPSTAPHPANPEPGDWAEPSRPPQPSRAGTRPLSLQSRVGGKGGPRRAGWAARPKPQTGMRRRGRRMDGRPRSRGQEAGYGWGRRKSPRRSRRSRRSQGRAPGAPLRAGSVAPVLGWPSQLFPPPPALPRVTAPAAGGAKLTYLEPDKQEPLRHGSQSPPRVTGAATTNERCCHQPPRPIQLHSGLRAPSRSQPMGTRRRRAQPPDPQPPLPPPPRRRGAADWPGPRRGGTRAPGPVGARGPGAAGVARGGVERRPPPSGLAPQLGWGRAALLVAQLSSSL